MDAQVRRRNVEMGLLARRGRYDEALMMAQEALDLVNATDDIRP